MADAQARIDAFTKLSWKEKITQLVTFYEAMIKKTENEEYIKKFQETIFRLKTFDDNEVSSKKVIDLYKKILWAEKKTQERKKQKSVDSLNRWQEALKELKQKEAEEEGDSDADDFLEGQLGDLF